MPTWQSYQWDPDPTALVMDISAGSLPHHSGHSFSDSGIPHPLFFFFIYLFFKIKFILFYFFFSLYITLNLLSSSSLTNRTEQNIFTSAHVSNTHIVPCSRERPTSVFTFPLLSHTHCVVATFLTEFAGYYYSVHS